MNTNFADPAFWHRLHFAFTITYHYLFPQLTMGLAWFIVYWKWKALRSGDEQLNRAARFWAKIFGLNFAAGVVTGIPMEFQFGTNWAEFSRYAGGTVGQTLAMEGMFAFFLESAFIWGEKRLGPRNHFLAALGVATGSWLSGYFIIVTNAFMQHPSGHAMTSDGILALADLGAYLGLLSAQGYPFPAGAALPECRHADWAHCVRRGGVPDGRRPGEDDRKASTRHAGSHGRTLPRRSPGGSGHDWSAERRTAPPREPDQAARRPELFGLWHIPELRKGIG
jgi:hypothetical protein